MKLKTTLLIALLTLNVFAAEETKEQKAKELMKIMEVSKVIDSSLAEVSKFTDQMVDAQQLSAEQKVKAKKIAKASVGKTFKAMKAIDWDKMFSEIYAEVFTKDELTELIKFYKSPIGKKFLEKQPQLTSATMQKMQVEMSKVMPQIQKDIQDAITKAKK